MSTSPPRAAWCAPSTRHQPRARGRRRTLGLVGRSGCGKSTLGKAMSKLVPIAGGAIVVDGVDVGAAHRRAPGRDASQGADDLPGPLRLAQPALDRRPLGHSAAGRRLEKGRRGGAVDTPLGWVGLPTTPNGAIRTNSPGGQRQHRRARASIQADHRHANRLSVSTLSVRAQVINLLEDLKSEFGVSYLFISQPVGGRASPTGWR